LLDVLMPSKDGWQVLAELKADARTRHIPVVVCTIMEEQGRAQQAGAAAYLVKPILQEELLEALEKLRNHKEDAAKTEAQALVKTLGGLR
ncbi:MAG: response regulator, partial [Chloroflexota bacterium]